MKKRKAETLMEVVTAMTLFGIIMYGMFDFMGNQAQVAGQLNMHNTLMYHLQKFINTDPYPNSSTKQITSQDKALGALFVYDTGNSKTDRLLKVMDQGIKINSNQPIIYFDLK